MSEFLLFGTLLKYRRTKAGLTRSALTDQLIDLDFDIGSSTIYSWETGARLPNDSRVFHFLGKCLDLSDEEEDALIDTWLKEKNYRDLLAYEKVKRESNG
jgi:hypothetical protein